MTEHLIGKNVLELQVTCQFHNTDSVMLHLKHAKQNKTSPIRSWLDCNHVETRSKSPEHDCILPHGSFC